MRWLRRIAPVLVLVSLATGCSDAEGPGAGPTTPPPLPSATSDSAPASAEPPAAVPHRVSLPALAQKAFDGGGLTLGEEVARTARHRQYAVTYRGGGLTVSGRLAVPEGPGPFPAVVLAHGYIDPAIYANGQGMTRERAWFGDHGYVALHVDYRGHAGSDADASGGLDMRMGYTEDVVNAVLALRAWPGPVDDERVALVGRSMGGGVVYNALVVRPGLVDAAVVFAPVSSDAVDNFERWIRPDPARDGVAGRILRRYGEPAANPAFWAGISARTYFGDVTEPVLIHHGTSDDSCPIRWSRATTRLMERTGVDVTMRTYVGEEHAFGPQWDLSMQRTGRFLRRHLA
ncbi:prolyl oligopeptidase family serine peptidase [Nocardioides carbamazepini]|uniref:alpha/beta hydrolase family protein n=1 Tax=Nocardioides carbamazepini TaxID=2854259 RepID=UPI00214A4CED|nr:prolyl oligopeptidase family serine peptidase [Nocardioides carbamazepini]MCR1782638.1 prolyl oligopeptidase family serine peptidase [Nocardioides carbamazepini]